MFVENEMMVCSDCLMLIANGDTPPELSEEKTEEWLAQIAKHYGEDQSGVCCGDSEKNEEFSWSGCDFCGSNLGGARHHCVELKER